MVSPIAREIARIMEAIIPDDSSFFFNDTATTEIYTLSLHDALPIFRRRSCLRRGQFVHGKVRSARATRLAFLQPGSDCASRLGSAVFGARPSAAASRPRSSDRKSTRLNSSHSQISYAVFCLKKKREQ